MDNNLIKDAQQESHINIREDINGLLEDYRGSSLMTDFYRNLGRNASAQLANSQQKEKAFHDKIVNLVKRNDDFDHIFDIKNLLIEYNNSIGKTHIYQNANDGEKYRECAAIEKAFRDKIVDLAKRNDNDITKSILENYLAFPTGHPHDGEKPSLLNVFEQAIEESLLLVASGPEEYTECVIQDLHTLSGKIFYEQGLRFGNPKDFGVLTSFASNPKDQDDYTYALSFSGVEPLQPITYRDGQIVIDGLPVIAKRFSFNSAVITPVEDPEIIKNINALVEPMLERYKEILPYVFDKQHQVIQAVREIAPPSLSKEDFGIIKDCALVKSYENQEFRTESLSYRFRGATMRGAFFDGTYRDEDGSWPMTIKNAGSPVSSISIKKPNIYRKWNTSTHNELLKLDKIALHQLEKVGAAAVRVARVNFSNELKNPDYPVNVLDSHILKQKEFALSHMSKTEFLSVSQKHSR